MNEPSPIQNEMPRLAAPAFVSHSSSDRKAALSICEALERHGIQCWSACRDVAPGDNYQEAIVGAIRGAGAVVLVFSAAANCSDEIKKELSLASRYGVPLFALRIENVEPSDAFAYELSTRQWIDAFAGWSKAIDALAHRIEQVSALPSVPPQEPSQHRHLRQASRAFTKRTLVVAASLVALLLIAGAGWLLFRPGPATAHTMQVRLTRFERLSPDLPATMPDAMRDEIIAAFNKDGVIGISTAVAPPPGRLPAYALGGTVRREGDKILVIARLSNERSGTTLWSNSFIYPSSNLSRVPRQIAVSAGNVVRCGLFGASTYPRQLPDAVLTDYLQFCHNGAIIEFDPTRALDFAHKVVAAVPDFSWGWSAVEKSASLAILNGGQAPEVQSLRAQGLDAAARAIRLDPANSEALAVKSILIDQSDLVVREALLRQAIQARPLACGCEHHLYGSFLQEVGRQTDAIAEYRRSTDVLAINSNVQGLLGAALLIAGKPEEAKEHFEAFVDLAPDPATARSGLALFIAPITRDYRSGQAALNDPGLQLSAQLKAAIGAAFHALQSDDPRAKQGAAAQLVGLPPGTELTLRILLLGDLGANAAALKMIEDSVAGNGNGDLSQLFAPPLAGARADPAFPGVVQRLGLIKYWRSTHTRPDVCSVRVAPPFCRMI